MSEYVDLPNGPDAVREVASRLTATADEFKAKAQGILGDIEAIEAGAPWGDDETGRTFLDQYHKQVDTGHGTVSFAEALKEKLNAAGDDLDGFGTATNNAMTAYESTDTLNASDIASA